MSSTDQSIPPSREVREDAWWRSGANFHWIWPLLHVYTPADTKPRGLLNRYPHNVIGAGVVLFGRCWCVQWKCSSSRKRQKAAMRHG